MAKLWLYAWKQNPFWWCQTSMRAGEFSATKAGLSSKEKLVGATLGGYLILTIVLFCWGDLLFRSDFEIIGAWGTSPRPSPEFDFTALTLLVPAMLVAFLSFLQIRFGRAKRLTSVSLWANFLAILGFGLFVAAGELDFLGVGTFGARVALVCLPVGLVLALLDLIWSYLRTAKAGPS